MEELEKESGNKQTLIDGLKKLASEAFWKAKNKDFNSLKTEFEKLIKNNLTEEMGENADESESVNVEQLIQEPVK